MTTPNPKLPANCFTVSDLDGSLILIQNGEQGYYPSSWSTNDPEENRRIADSYNQKLGITPEQEKAMSAGSMFGWDVPAADPDFWRKAKPLSDQISAAEKRTASRVYPTRAQSLKDKRRISC